MSEKCWIVYDGRAAGGAGTDDACVYVSCESLREAKRYVREDFHDGEIYEYDVEDRNLVNEQWIPQSYR